MLDAEILSLDSMALVRHFDLGTAKPTAAERQAVPHHLLDLIEPSEEFSVAEYVAEAEPCVAQIVARGREALFVGGTPLYLKALLRGLFEGPAADWPLRRELAEFARLKGAEALHRRLTAIDPAAARRLPVGDVRRIIRAIEVYEKTGRPISAWQRQFDVARPAEQCRVFVLEWPRAELCERIDRRVDAMFAGGLVEEVRALTSSGEPWGRTASQAVGYREVREFLAGRLTLEEAIVQVKLHTRQFAKRQSTWFRSLSECRVVPLAGSFDPARTAAQIVELGAG